ncbi:hypothetical protein [Streptomyces montanisoli]|uniref:Uncharacterized protein n=1 Tax=Streptomyces montanisoli TaxID=2798581 RepID=A0A940MF03_9ACTN|nr:hypothetical protein [Streptomyces montanisoli]MBP0459842.1 hypothetical protein [Streptomyces montanisoli]
MERKNCVTRNHIGVWRERALPAASAKVTFGALLRGSLLPLVVWTGIACFVYFVYAPAVAAVLGGLFALSFLVGYRLRRRAGHSVRCSVYGAAGGVLDKSMAGF